VQRVFASKRLRVAHLQDARDVRELDRSCERILPSAAMMSLSGRTFLVHRERASRQIFKDEKLRTADRPCRVFVPARCALATRSLDRGHTPSVPASVRRSVASREETTVTARPACRAQTRKFANALLPECRLQGPVAPTTAGRQR
jgi:hypothetical protein